MIMIYQKLMKTCKDMLNGSAESTLIKLSMIMLIQEEKLNSIFLKETSSKVLGVDLKMMDLDLEP